jgi:hypothetical protein
MRGSIKKMELNGSRSQSYLVRMLSRIRAGRHIFKMTLRHNSVYGIMGESKETSTMNYKQYRSALGRMQLSQIKAGEIFGLQPRQSQRIATGESKVPRPISKLVNLVLKGKITIADVDKAG